MKNEHLGSSFDEFLEEEGLRADAEAAAIKRIIAYQIELEMKQAKLSKTAMAEKMHTSRTALDRLLDPTNVSVTLQTLERAALALGKSLKHNHSAADGQRDKAAPPLRLTTVR